MQGTGRLPCSRTSKNLRVGEPPTCTTPQAALVHWHSPGLRFVLAGESVAWCMQRFPHGRRQLQGGSAPRAHVSRRHIQLPQPPSCPVSDAAQYLELPSSPYARGKASTCLLQLSTQPPSLTQGAPAPTLTDLRLLSAMASAYGASPLHPWPTCQDKVPGAPFPIPHRAQS